MCPIELKVSPIPIPKYAMYMNASYIVWMGLNCPKQSDVQFGCSKLFVPFEQLGWTAFI